MTGANRLFPVTAGLLGILLMTACGEGGSPLAPDAPSLSHHTASGPSVNGFAYSSFFRQTAAFHARILSDGTVQGTLQLKSRNQGEWIHGNVTCLEVAGNTATLGGEVTRGTSERGREYVAFVLMVEDNGEGAGAVDKWSDVLVFQEGFVPEDGPCSDPPSWGPVFPTERGNVQVKSG